MYALGSGAEVCLIHSTIFFSFRTINIKVSMHFYHHKSCVLYSGTGKTVTLVECALQLLSKRLNEDGSFSDNPSRGTSPRLLLCAPQNYSADLICSALAEAGLTPRVMTRLQDPRRRPAEVAGGVNDRAHSILHCPFCIIIVTVVFSLAVEC